MPKEQSINDIHFKGSRRYGWKYFFHKVLTVSWPGFFLGVIVSFFLINATFGLLYFLTRSTSSSMALNYWSDVYFSIVTFTTLGYGDIVPIGIGRLITAVNVLSGIIFAGVLTSFLFSRFSKTPSPLVWSNPVVYFHQNGKAYIQMRVSNVIGNEIINAFVHFYVMRSVKTPSGQAVRRLIPVSLERSHAPNATFNWLVSHVVDEHSPLKEWIDGTATQDETLLGFIHGFDAALGREVYSGARWQVSELVHGEFADMMFNFKATPKKVSVDMYLDNLDKVIPHQDS